MYQLQITLKSGLTLIDYCDGDPEAVKKALTEGKENVPMGELIVTAGAVADWNITVDKTYTEDDVRTAFATLLRKGQTHVAKRILAKYGASKLSELDPEKYTQVMEDING